MNGLIKPTTGTISFDNKPLSDDNIRFVRHRMGYVIQDGGLFPHLTARQNVTLLMEHLGESPQSISDRVKELTALVQLPPDRLDHYPAELSGGQQQRVSLIRALMTDPDVLLLDEPLGALDPMIRSDLQQDLRAIFRQLKKTVVLVTHDLYEAGYFADTVILLRHGTIEQQGAFQSLIDQPATSFVTSFVQAQKHHLS